MSDPEVSFGGHLGWLATSGDSLIQSKALALLLQLPLGRLVEVRGEAFTGQAIAGLGGGAIGQNLGVGGVPVRTRGGWGQLLIRPSKEWEFVGHIQWRPSPLILGLEYRHIATTYGLGKEIAGHVNLALGAEF